MVDTYTWINFNRNISTTQKLVEATENELAEGFYFVGKDDNGNWVKCSTVVNKAIGVVSQIWRDKYNVTGDICTIGDGVFVRVDDGDTVDIGKQGYLTTNGTLTTDSSVAGAVALNCYVTEVGVNLLLPSITTPIAGARIGYNSAL